MTLRFPNLTNVFLRTVPCGCICDGKQIHVHIELDTRHPVYWAWVAWKFMTEVQIEVRIWKWVIR